MSFQNLFVGISLLLLVSCAGGQKVSLDENDPNMWLEEVEGEKALSWVSEQNKSALSELTQGKRFKSMESQALKILESKDKIPGVTMMGTYLYNFWKDDKHVRGIWRRTSLQSYKTKRPKWETVLSIDKLAKKEKENWVFQGYDCLSPQYKKCLIRLSRGGKDAAVVREFDVAKKAFVKDGFELPEAKSAMQWYNENTVFVATDFGEGSMNESGYPRLVKLWKRGEPLKRAKLIFESKKKDMYLLGYNLKAWNKKVSVINRRIDFFSGDYYRYRTGKLDRIPLQRSAELKGFINDHYIVMLREDWKVGTLHMKKGSLIGMSTGVHARGKASDKDIQVLYTSDKASSIRSVSFTKNYILLNLLENVRGKIYKVGFSKGRFTKLTKVNLLKNAHLVISDASVDSDNYFFKNTGFLNPDSLYYFDSKRKKALKVKSLPKKFHSVGMGVKQLWATSHDGTKVPYFLVGKKSVIKKGNAPTLMYGYGGFEVSRTPRYNPLVGKLWLEKGGVYVLANIRGGGEFGPRWHQAALKTKRHKAYDDFISVGEDLIKRKITTKKNLAIQGGSNGGLLVGAVMTRRPDLFGAVLCHVPLLDMIRYSQLLAGASWMAEYGDPRDPTMNAYLRSYSPYHKVSADKKYPELFVLTSTKDDRVHPAHARKMVARMQKQGHKNLRYYENTEGGHKGAANLKQSAKVKAMTFEFLYKTIY